jgi:membrane protease YdiL (CAAX protease family)
MPGPVAFGVHKALAEQREKAERPSARFSPGQGWMIFVASTMCLSWGAAGLLFERWNGGGEPVMVRLWWASAYYALTMGWQPIVGAWLARYWREQGHAVDSGMHMPRVRDVGVAMLVALGLGALAMVVARIAGEPTQVFADPATSGGSSFAAVAAMVVLCIQAVTEEYGWRGAPLAYALERWGHAGLLIHGATWGLWYAPLFVFSTSSPAESLETAGGFVVTCMLLGIVFGWLRLRSKSLLPSAIANALLTIVAGLPLLLRDGSVGIRDAVFRWPGWPVIGAVALFVLIVRRRDLGLAARTS